MTKKTLSTAQFVAAVLWMHGRTTGEIAKVVGWTPGTLRGFITRQFEKSREHMTAEERQEILDAFKADRLDGGRLKDEHFKPIDLQGKPATAKALESLKARWVECLFIAGGIEDSDRRSADQRQCNIAHRAELDFNRKGGLPKADGGVDLLSKEGRKQARAIESDVMRLLRAKQKRKAAREAGFADRRGRDAAALDYLYQQRLLKDRGTANDGTKTSEEMRRLEAGQRLRSYLDGHRVGPMGAIDYERATMGSGGGAKMTLSAYKLHCIQALGSISKLMSPSDYQLIEAVVDRDAFVWEDTKAGGKARARIFDAIRHLLDVIAVHESLMTREAYYARWGEHLPDIKPANRAELARQAADVADFMERAR